MLRLFYFRKTAAGLNDAYDKKENEERKPDCLQRSVYVLDDRLYGAAPEFRWGFSNKPPYFGQFIVPCFKGVLEVADDPVVTFHSKITSQRLSHFEENKTLPFFGQRFIYLLLTKM